MKSKKSKIRSTIALLLLCSSVIIGGCGTKEKENVASSITESSEINTATVTHIETADTSTDTPTNIPTTAPTIALTATPASIAGAVLENVAKDLDGNGVNDNIQVVSLNDDGGETGLCVYLNEEKIFEYESPLVRIMGIDTFEYLDLDEDNGKEIFIAASTNANCRPYEEVLCLKQSDGKWNRMNYPKNDGGYNEFPFKITRGKEEFDFIISSNDTDQVIYFDASQCFEDDESDNPDSIQEYRKNNYKEGDEVGFISAWGIHDAITGTYKDRNCIIANQWIEGPYGHCLGQIDIYYAYNGQGKVEILKVEYLPD